jgi:hypothetical protein
MASPVFYITQPMLDVLRAVKRRKPIGSKLERAFYVLKDREMINGPIWDKPTLMSLGERTLSLVSDALKVKAKR